MFKSANITVHNSISRLFYDEVNKMINVLIKWMRSIELRMNKVISDSCLLASVE